MGADFMGYIFLGFFFLLGGLAALFFDLFDGEPRLGGILVGMLGGLIGLMLSLGIFNLFTGSTDRLIYEQRNLNLTSLQDSKVKKDSSFYLGYDVKNGKKYFLFNEKFGENTQKQRTKNSKHILIKKDLKQGGRPYVSYYYEMPKRGTEAFYDMRSTKNQREFIDLNQIVLHIPDDTKMIEVNKEKN